MTRRACYICQYWHIYVHIPHFAGLSLHLTSPAPPLRPSYSTWQPTSVQYFPTTMQCAIVRCVMFIVRLHACINTSGLYSIPTLHSAITWITASLCVFGLLRLGNWVSFYCFLANVLYTCFSMYMYKALHVHVRTGMPYMPAWIHICSIQCTHYACNTQYP